MLEKPAESCATRQIKELKETMTRRRVIGVLLAAVLTAGVYSVEPSQRY
jgi:RecB family endonuclease NucS